VNLRRQLPVSSPVLVSALVAGFGAALTRDAEVGDVLSAELARHFDVARAFPCDSGTSALVLALRAAVPPGGIVAFPSYACVDLAAAALYANVRVRLYDLVPSTLDADLDSLTGTLRRGADAVVAAHLYGYPVDVPAIRDLAHAHGAAVIEDAAQAAGGRLRGRPVGGLGDVSVLSFGRGKGTTGGRGGAILCADVAWTQRLEKTLAGRQRSNGAGWRDLTLAAAQWLLGRPSLYGLPASIPGLRLGEMVYHPAHEPEAISAAAASLVRVALRHDAAEVERRRRNAAALEGAARSGSGLTMIRPIAGAEPGYLRFPVLDSGSRLPVPALGIARGYPRALFEQEELRPNLIRDEPEPPGGRRLRESLFTLPAHGRLTMNDLHALRAWLQRAGSS
jgi:dTDP-4-amino-4,6-dideoxygalactose transaminase